MAWSDVSMALAPAMGWAWQNAGGGGTGRMLWNDALRIAVREVPETDAEGFDTLLTVFRLDEDLIEGKPLLRVRLKREGRTPWTVAKWFLAGNEELDKVMWVDVGFDRPSAASYTHAGLAALGVLGNLAGARVVRAADGTLIDLHSREDLPLLTWLRAQSIQWLRDEAPEAPEAPAPAAPEAPAPAVSTLPSGWRTGAPHELACYWPDGAPAPLATLKVAYDVDELPDTDRDGAVFAVLVPLDEFNRPLSQYAETVGEIVLTNGQPNPVALADLVLGADRLLDWPARGWTRWRDGHEWVARKGALGVRCRVDRSDGPPPLFVQTARWEDREDTKAYRTVPPPQITTQSAKEEIRASVILEIACAAVSPNGKPVAPEALPRQIMLLMDRLNREKAHIDAREKERDTARDSVDAIFDALGVDPLAPDSDRYNPDPAIAAVEKLYDERRRLLDKLRQRDAYIERLEARVKQAERKPWAMWGGSR